MTALYEAMMEDFVFMEKVRTPDGLGGWTTAWSTGTSFKASVRKDNSLEAREAERSGLTEVYTITVYRDVPIEYHDVIKRTGDGQTFRITSNITDNKSPTFSSINFGQVSAERWTLE